MNTINHYSKALAEILCFLFLVLTVSCKKDVQKIVYDNVIYGVDSVSIYSSNAEKTRQKSPEQFVSILYSNFTNQSIPPDDLNNISEVTYSIGDKGLVNSILLENFLNKPEIEIPSDTEMRTNPGEFVENTYLKFYLRKPSEYEKYYFTHLIQNDSTITPEMIYSSFAQSNEYLFY